MSCSSIVRLERGKGGGEDPLLRLELKLSWEVVGSFGDRDFVCVQGMGWVGKGRVVIDNDNNNNNNSEFVWKVFAIVLHGLVVWPVVDCVPRFRGRSICGG